MNRELHVCIYCGDLKSHPQEKCASCGSVPETLDDRNKSLILSTSYYLPEEDYLGKSHEELLSIANAIRSGQPYDFDEEELRHLNEYAQEVMSFTPGQLLHDYLIWQAPVIVTFALLALFHYGDGRLW